MLSHHTFANVTRFGLTGLFVLLPMVWVPDLIHPYDIPKQSLFFLLAAPLMGAFALSLRGRVNPEPLPAVAGVSVYGLAILLSLFQCTNRYLGIVMATQSLLALGLFWVAASSLKGPRCIIQLFRWAAFAAALVSALGIAQAWGIQTPGLVPVAGPAATFGNVNVAAEYLLLVAPMAFASFWKAKGRWEVAFHIFLTAIILTYLSYTGSRGAWLGFLAATLILFTWCLSRGFTVTSVLKTVRPKTMGIAAITGIVLIMNLVPRLSRSEHVNLVIAPPSPCGAISDMCTMQVGMLPEERKPLLAFSSLQSRLGFWRNTWVMVKEHPFLGVGKGNFPTVYPLYARRVIQDLEMSTGKRVDRVHNDYLQILAETGILGLLGFTCILGALGRKMFQSLVPSRSADEITLVIASAFGLVSLLTAALFGFPFQLATQESLFWVLAGIGWRVSQTPDTMRPALTALTTHLHGRKRILAFLMAILATASALWGLNTFMAEVHYSQGTRALRDGRLEKARFDLDYAVRMNPFESRFLFLLSYYEMNTGQAEKAVVHAERALGFEPYRLQILNLFGASLGQMGRYNEATQALKKAVALWPDFVEAHINLGLVYAKSGQREQAIAQYRTALRLRPHDAKTRRRLDQLLRGRNGV